MSPTSSSQPVTPTKACKKPSKPAQFKRNDKKKDRPTIKKRTDHRKGLKMKIKKRIKKRTDHRKGLRKESQIGAFFLCLGGQNHLQKIIFSFSRLKAHRSKPKLSQIRTKATKRKTIQSRRLKNHPELKSEF